MPTAHTSQRPFYSLRFGLFVLLLLVPSMFSVTNQSLWIDEARSCWFADHGRIVDLKDYQWLASVPQMPLFHLLLLGWVRIAGDSERALRTMNLPFAALFVGAIALICRQRGGPRWWLAAVPFSVFPMLVYYVNECRPYAAILGLSTAAVVAYLCYLESESRKSAFLCGLFALCALGMHTLGGLTTLVLILYSLFHREVRARLASTWRRWVPSVALVAPGYLALAVYYVRMYASGIPQASHAALTETPTNLPSTWKNFGFFFYEFLGFAGLGPPRNELRVRPTPAMFIDYAPLLLVGVAACAALVYLYWKGSADAREARGMSLAGLIGLLALFIMARAIHFGFLGRHAMGVVGILCVALALVLCAKRLSTRSRAVASIILALAWGTSSARLLFSYNYGKDDPRSALAAAKATGLPILWDGDVSEAAYYGGFDANEPQSMFLLAPARHPAEHWKQLTPLHVSLRWDEASIDRLTEDLPAGRYVMVSGKADIFDPEGNWKKAIPSWEPVLLNRFVGYEVRIITLPAPRSP